MFRIIVLTVVVFFSTCFIGVVFGMVTCYSCDTIFDWDNTACLDPMKPYPSVGIIMCTRAVYCTSVQFDAKNKTIAFRSCEGGDDPCGQLEEKYTRWYPDISNYLCYNCTGDYCNDASFNSTETMENIELLDLN